MKPSTLIRKHGWIQGRNGSKACGLCMAHAVEVAYGLGTLQTNKVFHKLKEHLCIAYLSDWNDDTLRTKSQVIKALRAIGE